MGLRLEPYAVDPGPGAANARRTWSRRAGLFVHLSDGDFRGTGESAPLPGYSPDTLEETQVALISWCPSREASEGFRHVLGARDFPGIPAAVESLVRTLPEGLPAARFGLETALLDGASRRLGMSVADLLWGDGRAFSWQPIRSQSLWTSLEPPDADGLGLRAGASGLGTVLKVKVGRQDRLQEEGELLREIRRRFPELELRLDANGSWSPEQALETVQAWKGLGIRWIEEPCAWSSWAEVVDWSAVSPIPVALDESLWKLGPPPRDPAGFEPAALILKPQLLGGVLPCLRLAEDRAECRALASHCFDGPAAFAATTTLAQVLDRRFGSEAHGLARHGVLDAFPPIGGRS